MAVNRATIVDRFAYLSEDFGKELAMKKFNLTVEDLEQIVGRYVKGKRKGLLRGKICWVKCIKGGWVKTGPYDHEAQRANGYVESPGRCSNFNLYDAWTDELIRWSRDKDGKIVMVTRRPFFMRG